jgi:DNA-binding NarL/FixJ family response regulator
VTQNKSLVEDEEETDFEFDENTDLGMATETIHDMVIASRKVKPHGRLKSNIMQALESGAHGYLLKDTTATELEHALDALRNNERYLSPAIAHTVINQALIRNQKHQPEAADSHNLTARQLEILRLIVRGKSTREIANGLGLSIKTVETHRSQIMKRLQIYDVAGLVLFAVREQIISLDD